MAIFITLAKKRHECSPVSMGSFVADIHDSNYADCFIIKCFIYELW